jgi:tetratricopeptide (TPR) repeat protein
MKQSDESKYLERLAELWPRQGEAIVLCDLRDIAEEAVKNCPHSSALWRVRGEILELFFDQKTLPLVFACYSAALILNPDSPDTLEDIGYFCDIYSDAYDVAAIALRKARLIRDSRDAVHGLGRVLAEMGAVDEALDTIEKSRFKDDPQITQLVKDIRAGVWGPTTVAHQKRKSEKQRIGKAAPLRLPAKKRRVGAKLRRC